MKWSDQSKMFRGIWFSSAQNSFISKFQLDFFDKIRSADTILERSKYLIFKPHLYLYLFIYIYPYLTNLLTITFSTSITFLDIKIYKNENGTLCTSIYKKSSDRLPYTQALCIKQICSKSSEITKHLKDLNDAFNWRGY